MKITSSSFASVNPPSRGIFADTTTTLNAKASSSQRQATASGSRPFRGLAAAFFGPLMDPIQTGNLLAINTRRARNKNVTDCASFGTERSASTQLDDTPAAEKPLTESGSGFVLPRTSLHYTHPIHLTTLWSCEPRLRFKPPAKATGSDAGFGSSARSTPRNCATAFAHRHGKHLACRQCSVHGTSASR